MDKHSEHSMITLQISGMNCHSCAKTIEKALNQIPEVASVQVNYATERAAVHLNHAVDPSILVKAVEATGYHAQPVVEGHGGHSGHLHDEDAISLERRLLLAAILSAPFFVQMLAMLVGVHLELPAWLQFILATIVQFVAGWNFYRASYLSAKVGSANMDVLIMLGTTAAYLLSCAAWIFGWHESLYFESSASIITLVLLGRWLESRSKRKASEAVNKLLSIQPKIARVLRNDQFVDLPVDEIVKGDIVVVAAGERIAVDAKVIEGESEVNEAMITGESIPRMKMAGDKVLAGTINESGSLKIKAEEMGSHTVLAGIVRLVERTQNSQAPVQRLADKVAEIFVPAVLVISLITFLVWWFLGGGVTSALINAVAVLVIACPCALGLATPIVILVASGRAASSGILYKEASAIEKTSHLNVICFDKTGTLTVGKPSVTDLIPKKGDARHLLTIAASLERLVQHPIAESIVARSEEEGVELEQVLNFRSLPGKGITGEIHSQSYSLGALRFARESSITIDEQLVSSLEAHSKTVSILWRGKEVEGYIATSDSLRPHAREAVSQLMQQGIQPILLTGDHLQTAQSIAEQAGIKDFFAELLPEDKLKAIDKLKSENNKVAMVGDGINDAPALAAADVGMALGAASDVAMETATIALLRDDLMGVVEAIDLSKAAFRIIKQNLFFAFIYNILAIPLAVFGLLNPIIAAAAMAMSSLSVVLNALRLRRRPSVANE